MLAPRSREAGQPLPATKILSQMRAAFLNEDGLERRAALAQMPGYRRKGVGFHPKGVF
jgi:hypothetical protein